jgi:hypothetical protein
LKDLPEVQGLVREPSWKPAAPEVETTEEVPDSTEVTEQTAE